MMIATAPMPDDGPLEPLFVSVDKAATLVGLSSESIRRLLKAGRLPYARHGRKVLVSVSGLKTAFPVTVPAPAMEGVAN